MPALRSAARPRYARPLFALGTAIAAAAVVASVAAGAPWWVAALAWAVPDVPLLFGMGRGMGYGRLHPRAVPAYNALHTPWGPVALAVLTAAAGFPPVPLAVVLAWTFHICLDRAAGYGLRTPDGYQRGA